MAEQSTQQLAFLSQARADFEAFRSLRTGVDGVRPCHSLLMLQMCAEKLAKAIVLVGQPVAPRTHVAISKITGQLNAEGERIAELLGHRQKFRVSQRQRKILREIEELSPAVATGGHAQGANVEYPWATPTGAWVAPAKFEFPVEQALAEPEGMRVLKLLWLLLYKFDRIFA